MKNLFSILEKVNVIINSNQQLKIKKMNAMASLPSE